MPTLLSPLANIRPAASSEGIESYAHQASEALRPRRQRREASHNGHQYPRRTVPVAVKYLPLPRKRRLPLLVHFDDLDRIRGRPRQLRAYREGQGMRRPLATAVSQGRMRR
jgi:hypothetical protein